MFYAHSIQQGIALSDFGSVGHGWYTINDNVVKGYIGNLPISVHIHEDGRVAVFSGGGTFIGSIEKKGNGAYNATCFHYGGFKETVASSYPSAIAFMLRTIAQFSYIEVAEALENYKDES